MKQKNFAHRIGTWLWWLFLAWTAVVACVMPFEIGPHTVDALVRSAPLNALLKYVLSVADAVWIVLGASVVYLGVIRDAGALARVWSGIILAGSALIGTVGARTDCPFGPLEFTDNMGARLFGVLPFTIPLLWLIVVLAGRYLVLWRFPCANRWQIASATALLALLTDLNLEFVAWKVRAYWIWYPAGTPLAFNPPAWPPWQNFAAWFTIAFLLTALLPDVTRPPRAGVARPILILVALNALFLLVHAVRWMRSFH